MKKIISSYVIFSMVFGTVAFSPITAIAGNNNHNNGYGDNNRNDDRGDNDRHDRGGRGNHDWNDNNNNDEEEEENEEVIEEEIVEEETPIVVLDACINIDGDQETIPEGYEMVDDSCLPVPPPVTTATLIATKIVCDSETDLPNFGSGTNITGTTATDFLATHPNCHAEAGWNFEWAPDGTPNPGSSMIGQAGGAWNTFGQTLVDGTASTIVPAGALIWVREVLKEGFIPFSDDITEPLPVNPVSAEMYCNTDGYNYDNYDWISPVNPGNTYNCVAFNAPVAVVVEEPTDVCSNIEEVQENIPEGMVSNDGQCVTPENGGGGGNPVDVCANIDGVQTEAPQGKVISGEDCVDAPADEVPACTANCGGGSGGNPAPAANGPIVGSFAGTLPASTGSIGEGQVLGASCSVYLNDYLRIGKNNDVEEVKKLQIFLNEYMSLSLEVSGIFDTATLDAVHAFQAKEDVEVLQPWVKLGLLKEGETTGYVFKTTKRRINMIKCAELNIPIPDLTTN